MLTIKKTVENNKATLAPEGRLDSSTAPTLESAVKEVLSDITDLTFDSSAGLRVLLSAQKVMDTKGKMKVTGVNEDIMDIFEITGFSDILRIES